MEVEVLEILSVMAGLGVLFRAQQFKIFVPKRKNEGILG
jgi:hypothetical protein